MVSSEVKIIELRKQENPELNARAAELKRTIFSCRSAGVGAEEKKLSGKKRSCRKELARILTVKREREINEVPREPLL